MKVMCVAFGAILASSCLLAAVAHVPAPLVSSKIESKRDVADRLISLAEEHKELSLHDVLRDREKQLLLEGTAKTDGVKRVKGGGARSKEEKAVSSSKIMEKEAASVVQKAEVLRHQGRKPEDEFAPGFKGRRGPQFRSLSGGTSRDGSRPHGADKRRLTSQRTRGERLKTHRSTPNKVAEDGGHVVVNAWSEEFARGVNGTVRHSELAAYINVSAMIISTAESRKRSAANDVNMPELRRPADISTALFRSTGNTLPLSAASSTSKAVLPVALPVLAALDELELDDVEAGVMLRALRVLRAAPVDEVEARVKALSILEELCHGAEEANDLQAAGGLQVVVGGLSSESSQERASAALTLSACAQNNPDVQENAVALGAVPVLLRLAAGDEPSVCSRALLALNALVELNAARQLLEDVVSSAGIEALRRPLVEQTNMRATRRALNLVELLAARNLDAWKTYIEAWDLSPVIESLLFHENADIRESAARLVTVLESF